MDSRLFIQEWIGRAEREEGVEFIDGGDKFISLWIAFNAWLKTTFGEDLRDRELIEKVKDYSFLKEAYKELSENKNDNFNSSLEKLRIYDVLDMRYPEEKDKMKRFDGSFPSLIEVIYQIRCNLFHGRKNYEENEVDKQLVNLGYSILLPLFKAYLERHSIS